MARRDGACKDCKADVLDAVGELVEALTFFADTNDREIELIVRTDGTCSLMGDDGSSAAGEALGFEEIENFDSFADMWVYITGEQEGPAAVKEAVSEPA